jgi:hypothetical protein
MNRKEDICVEEVITNFKKIRWEKKRELVGGRVMLKYRITKRRIVKKEKKD